MALGLPRLDKRGRGYVRNGSGPDRWERAHDRTPLH